MITAKNIMVVDDEAGTRNLLYGVLTEQGFRVTLARDGQDSWNQMKRKRFDLLITDINMPRLDGLGLLKRMQKNRRGEKVMVMTGGYLEYEDLGDNFPQIRVLLRKPFRISFFVETVTSLLASQNPENKQSLFEGEQRGRD